MVPHYLLVSPSGQLLYSTGKLPFDLLGHGWREFIHDADLSCVEDWLQQETETADVIVFRAQLGGIKLAICAGKVPFKCSWLVILCLRHRTP